MKTLKYPPIILVGTFFLFFLLLTPMGVFNDWIPPNLHTGYFSVVTIDFGDDSGYYAYLRSLFFDGDIDFINERFYSHLEDFNSTGYVFNNWQIGQSLLVFPFFILGHLGALVLSALGYSVALDGYSFPYYMSIALASQTYLFLGLLITFQINRKFFSDGVALLVTLLIWAASPLIYYTFIRQRMAHTVEFFLAALFVWVWLNNRRTSDKWKHAIMGSILGLLGSVRILGLGLVILYFVDWLLSIKQFSIKKVQINCLIFFVLFGLIFLSPQFVTWQIIEGFPLPIYNLTLTKSYNTSFDISNFFENVIRFILGHKWGILYSSPIIFFGAVGVIFSKNFGGFRIPVVMAMLAYFFLSIHYVNFLASYQYRYLIPIYPLVGIGLGYLFSKAFKYQFTRLIIIFVSIIFIIAQYFILIQYKISLVYNDPNLVFKALSNIPKIIFEDTQLLSRSTNIFKLISLDINFDWTFKEFSYFVFYPLFQLVLIVIGYLAFYRMKKYFEFSKNKKRNKIACVFGGGIILAFNIFLVVSGPKKTEAEIQARQNYVSFKKQANEAEAKGDVDETVRLLRNAVQEVPDFWPGNFKLALFLDAKGNTNEANKYYQKVLLLNPQQQGSKFNLAKNLKKIGRFQVAEALLRSAIEDDPTSPGPYQSLAQLLSIQNKAEEAERLFHRSISLDPNFKIAYLNFAILLGTLKRYEEAERNFNLAIAISLNGFDPKDETFGIAHLNFAVMLTELKRYGEAIFNLKIAYDDGVMNSAMQNLITFYGIQVYEVEK